MFSFNVAPYIVICPTKLLTFLTWWNLQINFFQDDKKYLQLTHQMFPPRVMLLFIGSCLVEVGTRSYTASMNNREVTVLSNRIVTRYKTIITRGRANVRVSRFWRTENLSDL